MKVSSDLLLLVIGFIAIIVLTRSIAKKISKYFSEKVSVFTYILVCLLGIYYLVDAILHSDHVFNSMYFYFWSMVIVIQAVFFTITIKRISKKTTENL